MRKEGFIVLLFTLVLICSCKSNPKTSAEKGFIPADSLTEKYEDEYFSIRHPKNWIFHWEAYVPESKSVARALKSKKLKSGAAELWSPDGRVRVRLVKSVLAWLNPSSTPRQWCELSAMAGRSDDECVGISQIKDSILIAGYPAAEITLAYSAGTDTLLQRQYAIVPKARELYYANIRYAKGDDYAYSIGSKMLHTLHLKVSGDTGTGPL